MDPDSPPPPRSCHIIKWPDFDGYGFNLHAEKGRNGQFIGKVDEGSPAEMAGLMEGDKIVEVNGVNISTENHRQVVERIKSIPNETKLLVLDEAAEKWYKEKKRTAKSSQPNVIFNKTPIPRPSPNDASSDPTDGEQRNNSENNNRIHSKEVQKIELHPEKMPQKKLQENGEMDSSMRTPSPREAKSNGKTEVNGNEDEGSTSSEPRPDSCQSEEKSEEAATMSIPDSPTSFKSGTSSGTGSRARSAATSSIASEPLKEEELDLNLNMSASAMREILAKKKRKDPKKIQMDIKQKYEIIQQM